MAITTPTYATAFQTAGKVVTRDRYSVSQPLGTLSWHWLYWLENNSSEGDYLITGPAATVPDHTDSTSTGANKIVFETPAGSNLMLMPFGTDAANEVFAFQVMGWANAHNGTNEIWTPFELWTGNCTLHSTTGVSGKHISNTDFFCDAITQTGGIDAAKELSCAVGALVQLDHLGFPVISIEFNMDTAATGNCLVGAW